MSEDNGSKPDVPVGFRVGGGIRIDDDGGILTSVQVQFDDRLDVHLSLVDAISFGLDLIQAATKSRSLAAALAALDRYDADAVDYRSSFLNAMVAGFESRPSVEDPDVAARGLTVVRREIEKP